jgi:hypothetical protein
MHKRLGLSSIIYPKIFIENNILNTKPIKHTYLLTNLERDQSETYCWCILKNLLALGAKKLTLINFSRFQ